jgi:hypothetical protein
MRGVRKYDRHCQDERLLMKRRQLLGSISNNQAANITGLPESTINAVLKEIFREPVQKGFEKFIRAKIKQIHQ